MIANGTHQNNGVGHHLNGVSDYEPRPLIDDAPTTPRPAWRAVQPLFCHHLEWVDDEQVAHGLTLRSDDLQALMEDLKLVKSLIRQSRRRAAEQTSPGERAPDTDAPICPIHGARMARKLSKRNGTPYLSHRLPEPGSGLCFGREPKA